MPRRRRRRRSSKLTLGCLNLALFLLLLEIVGLGDHFLKTRRLYYLSRPTAERLPAGRDPVNSVAAYRLHPYFGYVVRPATASEGERDRPQNNYGFDEPRDYPYVPGGDGELVVGLFGGSVAAKLHAFDSRRRILSGRLAAALGKQSSDVTLLNFAQGGFKQPQQLLIYSYFRSLGQPIDVVINVDGFNEIVLAAINVERGAAADMPSMDHIYGLREIVGGVEEGEGLDQMLRVRAAYESYAKRYNRAWSGEAWELTFAAGFFIDRKVAKIYRNRFRSRLEAYSNRSAASSESWLYLNPASGEGVSSEDDLSSAVELWARSSALMHSMQSDSGGLYLHFLQPNQYHPTRRVYGEHEKTVAFNAASLYAGPARRGYPRLRREAERLRDAGVPVHDLAEVFDDVAPEVYVDSCCHCTEAGQEIVVTAIADAVVSALEKRRAGG